MFTLTGMLLDTAFGLVIAVIAIGLVFAVVIGEYKLFVKAGIPGWKAIIPFYSAYVFTVDVCKMHWGWGAAVVLIDVGVVSTGGAVAILRLFVKAMSFYNLGQKLHQDPIVSLIFGAIFPEIMTCVYGFGNFTYDHYVEVKQSGLF